MLLEGGGGGVLLAERTGEVSSFSEEGNENKGKNSRELDEDVKGRSAGILQWITDGITDNSSFVFLRALLLDDSIDFEFA